MRCERIGSILRAGSGRVVSLCVDSTRKIIGCHGRDKTIELFELLDADEVKTKLAKRLKKQKEKLRSDEFFNHFTLIKLYDSWYSVKMCISGKERSILFLQNLL